MTPDLDIGVIYTHERAYMGPLLGTMRAAVGGLRARLVLVDNASEDGVADWADALPAVLVLRNDRPLGYADNLNRVLAASAAPFVLLMNTDMWFDPAEPCLEKMVRFLRRHPGCGVAGCRLLHRDGGEAYAARRFQTLATAIGRRTPLAPMLGATVDHSLYRDRRTDGVFDCDWLSGCFLMVRREAYLEAGGLDGGYRKYFEDVDFCRRIAAAGWSVSYNGRTFCYHDEQRASRRLLSRDAVLHARSYARYLAKWGLSGRMGTGSQTGTGDRRRAA